MHKNSGNIKSFLKHKNPNKLTDLMLENNLRTKSYHDYRIVFAEGFWYAWYEIDINDLLTEKMKDVRKRQG
jgi:hypothetical protein